MSYGSSSQFLVFREKLVVRFHVGYSHPQIDGKVNHHQISRDLLFHLFGDDYKLCEKFLEAFESWRLL
jgi:hypothetical protein